MSRAPNLPTHYEFTTSSEILDSIHELTVDECYKFTNKKSVSRENFARITDLIERESVGQKFYENEKRQLKDSIVMLMTMSKISLAETMMSRSDPSLFEDNNPTIDNVIAFAIKEVAARQHYKLNNYQLIIRDDLIFQTIKSLVPLVGFNVELVENRDNSLYKSIRLFMDMDMPECAQEIVTYLNISTLTEKNWQTLQQKYGDVLDFERMPIPRVKEEKVEENIVVVENFGTNMDDKKISSETSDDIPTSADVYHLVYNADIIARELPNMLQKLELSGSVLEEDREFNLCYTLAVLADRGEFNFIKKVLEHSLVDSIAAIDQRMIERVVSNSLNKILLDINQIVFDEKDSDSQENVSRELNNVLMKIFGSGASLKENEECHLRDSVRMLVDMGMTDYADQILDNSNIRSIGFKNRNLIQENINGTSESKYIPSLINIHEMVSNRLGKYPSSEFNNSKNDFRDNFSRMLDRLSFADIILEDDKDHHLQATITNLLHMGEGDLTSELISHCEPLLFEVGAMKIIKDNLDSAQRSKEAIKQNEIFRRKNVDLEINRDVDVANDNPEEEIETILGNLKDFMSVGDGGSTKKGVENLRKLGCDQSLVLKTVIENRGPHGEYDVATDVLSFMLGKRSFNAGIRKIANEYESAEAVNDAFLLAVDQYLKGGYNEETDYELSVALLETKKVFGLEEAVIPADDKKAFADLLSQRDEEIQIRKNNSAPFDNSFAIDIRPDTADEPSIESQIRVDC